MNLIKSVFYIADTKLEIVVKYHYLSRSYPV